MKSTRKIIFLALMVGCGIMLQIIESFVPVVIFVPGFKIGFANIVSLLTLYVYPAMPHSSRTGELGFKKTFYIAIWISAHVE